MQKSARRSPYIFPAGTGYVSGFSKMKRAFDRKVQIAPWTFHDLRRTAKSLMQRAGVRPHICERVLGHAIAGVEGVYDRHQYKDEKADALKRLAQQITDIVIPPPVECAEAAGVVIHRQSPEETPGAPARAFCRRETTL